jgi:hypothetical protein
LRGFIQKRFGVDLDEVSIGRLLKCIRLDQI